MIKISFTILEWDIPELARALKIKENEVKPYFTDGRRISFLLERRIAYELDGETASSEGDPYDVIDSQGNKWEVRSITSSTGVYFCPSYMVGSGRSFDEEGFIKKVMGISGFIVCDISSFPRVPAWKISSEQVLSWWHSSVLGKRTKISRNSILNLL